MRKWLIVASTEFANTVRTKMFIFSLALMPVLMVGMFLFQQWAEKADVTERRFAIVDETGGVVGDGLERAAAAWNASVIDAKGKQTGPKYVPVRDGAAATDEQRLRLSQQIRDKQLFAFVEIPAGVARPDEAVKVRYYSNRPAQREVYRWLQSAITGAVINERFRQAAVDQAMVQRLTKRVEVDNLGLVERDAQGQVKPATEVDELRSFGVPIILMFLLFMPIMTITPQMVNTVLEEKMSRISEVLLGSLKPFELMLGKLVGVGGVIVFLALVYVAGAYTAAVYWGYADAVTPLLLAEFAIFLALGMLLFGSMYLAIGSACSTIKDAQSLVMPVSLLAVLPMMLLATVMRAPDSPLSVAMSFFPLATPYIMLMRAAMNPPAPFWQVGLSMITTAATTVAIVWAGARIFRTGLLMYGKAPTFGEMLKWVRA